MGILRLACAVLALAACGSKAKTESELAVENFRGHLDAMSITASCEQLPGAIAEVRSHAGACIDKDAPSLELYGAHQQIALTLRRLGDSPSSNACGLAVAELRGVAATLCR